MSWREHLVGKSAKEPVPTKSKVYAGKLEDVQTTLREALTVLLDWTLNNGGEAGRTVGGGVAFEMLNVEIEACTKDGQRQDFLLGDYCISVRRTK